MQFLNKNLILYKIAIVTLLFLSSYPSQSQQENIRIAAVVNEDIISLFDVQSRIKLYLTTSGIEDTIEIRQRLLPQVMNSLIDEKLKIQEAREKEIEISEKEVMNAIGRIEQNNGIKSGEFISLLSKQGISEVTLYDQVKADVAWLKVVREVLSRDINISEEEINAVIERLKSNQGRPEYLIAEINLPVVLGARDRDVYELASQLIKRAKEGAPFPALAQQFSQSPTAAVGGDLGWVPETDLENEIRAAIRKIKPGEISSPIRTLSGYTIIALRDQRSIAEPSPLMTAVTLSQIYIPTTGVNAVSESETNQLTFEIKNKVRGCQNMTKWGEEIGGPGSGDIELIRIGGLPKEIQNAVLGLKIGIPSNPISVPGAILFIMVCSKEDDNGLPSPNQVYSRLENEKLDTMSKQRLRDLRRQALIDIRL
jgi:peptidyl-prolyl cis-trans isomerase SurA